MIAGLKERSRIVTAIAASYSRVAPKRPAAGTYRSSTPALACAGSVMGCGLTDLGLDRPEVSTAVLLRIDLEGVQAAL